MDLKQLYQDIILDHGKSPRNFGKCVGYNSEAKGYNPLCGDLVQIYLKLNVEKKVEDLTFEGNGCAISMASASIMTDLVKGKSCEVAKKIIDAFLKMIKSSAEMKSDDLDDDQKTKIMSWYNCFKSIILNQIFFYNFQLPCRARQYHPLYYKCQWKLLP